MALQLSLFDPEPPRSGPPPSTSGRVLIVRGALAAEAALLERVMALLEEARRDPALLAVPVRIVVPSRSLRLHVADAVVRALRRSAAGLRIQTLTGLALEVLERAGETAPRGEPLFGMLAQRLARIESALRHGLEDLVDGYGAVAGTVRDLLDAGLEPIHAEAADEALAEDGPRAASRAEVERGRALVRVAANTERLLRQTGLGRASTLLRRAAELLESGPPGLLPARALLVHGFADATGVATDLLATLVRRRSAWVLLDRPPEPAGALGLDEAAGVERAYTERLAERLAAVLPPGEADSEPAVPPAPRLAAIEALGTDAEVREVAVRVRALLDAGARSARPEGIGIVARDLGRFRLALRRHLGRLGVPFSGVGERGSITPAGRRARAFLDLLERGEEVPSDRWLDALAAFGAGAGGLFVDLRLAFSALGAGRLRDAAVLPVDEVLRGESSYPLPIRQGLRSAEKEEAGEEETAGYDRSGDTYAARRRIAGSQLRGAVRVAGRVRERLAAWPFEARSEIHLQRLRALLTADLGWDPGAEDSRPVFAALAALADQVPADFLLTREELRLLLAQALKNAGAGTLGGGGGGVQVLSVMEARGRAFEHLFVLGLNRDLFPRPVREDPLLPDGLRRVLQRVLPDIPLKRAGFDEDRYLFAQLLSASPDLTLSWQIADDDGAPVSVSPLVERLRDALAVVRAPSLWERPREPPRLEALRPAAEHAVLAGLHGSRSDFGAALALAVAETRGEEASDGFVLPAGELAASRLAVLEEMDPDRRVAEGRARAARLGPYFGFVGICDPGGVSPAGEPRRRDLYVTLLENLAACPWQLFLGRLLRIEPTPDPLQALPGADPLLLGNLVHAVLARVVRGEMSGKSGPRAPHPLAPSPIPSPRPGEGEVQAGERGRPSPGGMGGDGRGDGGEGSAGAVDSFQTPVPLAAVLARQPVAVPWPAAAELDALLLHEAAALLAEEGIFLPGLARALADRARPFLEAARDADWHDADGGTVPVLGAEIEGELTVRDAAGRDRSIHFKADRLDHLNDGTDHVLRWTDYKTGKPISESRTAATRRRHFLERVRAGTHLQGVAYPLATEESGRAGVGRYLYLRPAAEERELAVTPDDRPFTRAFHGAVEALLGAWDSGSFFPRLVDTAGRNEPARCSFCAVAEACLRGDSGARLRLFEWTREAGARGEGTAAEAALLRLWRLAARGEAEPEEGAGEEEGAP